MPRSFDSSEDGCSSDEYSSDSESDSSKDSYGHRKNSFKRNINHRSEERVRKMHKPAQGVYVLRNIHTNTFYVGKSNNMDCRIEQHIQENDEGSLRLESNLTSGSTDDLESWERNEVLTRMYRHGMECVRGWRYTRKGPLTLDDKISARNDIMEKFDLCRRCGRNNHFKDKCYARTQANWCKDIPM